MARRRTSLLKELLLFLRAHRAYWLVPILVVLGLLIILGILGSTGAAPFVYTLF